MNVRLRSSSTSLLCLQLQRRRSMETARNGCFRKCSLQTKLRLGKKTNDFCWHGVSGVMEDNIATNPGRRVFVTCFSAALI